MSVGNDDPQIISVLIQIYSIVLVANINQHEFSSPKTIIIFRFPTRGAISGKIFFENALSKRGGHSSDQE